MQPKSAEALPEYDKPPVIEVVCGVKFDTLEPFSLPHFGLLWQQFRGEYPEFKQVAPLVAPIEARAVEGGGEIEFAEMPPLPRLWFISANQNALVQVQRDYFLHNWKKVRETDDYPRYGVVIQMFKERLATFETFLAEQGLPTINPIQY
ncbi:MAG: TIGR04255 family protein, partial [Anaerolineales bacterium]